MDGHFVVDLLFILYQVLFQLPFLMRVPIVVGDLQHGARTGKSRSSATFADGRLTAISGTAAGTSIYR
jgi:hypothetical protein